jgi:hypothetical protein
MHAITFHAASFGEVLNRLLLVNDVALECWKLKCLIGVWQRLLASRSVNASSAMTDRRQAAAASLFLFCSHLRAFLQYCSYFPDDSRCDHSQVHLSYGWVEKPAGEKQRCGLNLLA